MCKAPGHRYAGAMDTFYLDDLTIGQRFVSGTHTLDAAEITRFAAAYDPQPFHLDDAAARETLFGGLVASGWHTACTTMRLIVGGGLPIAGGIMGTGGELLWTNPVRRAIRCTSSARCWRSRHPARSRTAARWWCGA
jgi:acyl dehydratase